MTRSQILASSASGALIGARTVVRPQPVRLSGQKAIMLASATGRPSAPLLMHGTGTARSVHRTVPSDGSIGSPWFAYMPDPGLGVGNTGGGSIMAQMPGKVERFQAQICDISVMVNAEHSAVLGPVAKHRLVACSVETAVLMVRPRPTGADDEDEVVPLGGLFLFYLP